MTKINTFTPNYCTHSQLIPSPKGWWCECGAELDDRGRVTLQPRLDANPHLWED